MKCSKCRNKAIITFPSRCEKHFIESFEDTVWDTIRDYDLIPEDARICVAASGGKDSLALLSVLHQRYLVHALCVDEGIPGYRDQTIDDLREFCAQRHIPLQVVSFEDVGALPLFQQNASHPCSACGVLRRKALMEYSSNFDLIATGHNLDDEAQTVMMNFLRNQEHLMYRIGPKTPATQGIAVRVKPFYLIPEREVRAYCLVKGITTNFSECPNVVKSFRWRVGEALNDLEFTQSGSKRAIVKTFLHKYYQKGDAHNSQRCTRCGGPSSHTLCRGCSLIVINQTQD